LCLSGPAKNLEEHALSMVGTDIYNLLIKDYTVKQWQCDPKKLSADIIKRLPVRYTYDDNYFNDRYQGIPKLGYTALFEKMLDGIEVRINIDYFQHRSYWNQQANKIVFTGRIDEWFDYQFGELEYRTLDFETTVESTDNYQGNAVINYCDADVAWTRIIEHRHFSDTTSNVSVITREIPAVWSRDKIPYYPVNDQRNQQLYEQYRNLCNDTGVIFGGRLAEYRYYDMHQVIGSAIKKAKLELE
jgi:UDP-galactopyranose mutase